MAALFTKPSAPIGGHSIYVAAMPLRASKGPAQMFASLSYSLNFWDFQHFMVIVSSASSRPSSQLLVFDFQPQNPEDIQVALAALSGRSVPGVVLERKIARLPRTKCWYVGSCDRNSEEIACKFNKRWDTELRIGEHDCRDYTNGNSTQFLTISKHREEGLPSYVSDFEGLVEELTTTKNVLRRLRRSSTVS